MPGVMRVAARVCRVVAWVLVALVVAGAVLPAGPRSLLLGANGLASSFLPSGVSGLFVFVTPFGGAFRGDFALVALALFVLDWLLCHVAASLERGARG